MKILKTNKKLTLQDTYNLTMTPDALKLKSMAGADLEISAWAIYEDVDNSTGELHNILAIATPEGDVYGTNSATMMDDLTRMEELANSFGQTVTAVSIITGQSKKGREFVTCKMLRTVESDQRMLIINQPTGTTPAEPEAAAADTAPVQG